MLWLYPWPHNNDYFLLPTKISRTADVCFWPLAPILSPEPPEAEEASRLLLDLILQTCLSKEVKLVDGSCLRYGSSLEFDTLRLGAGMLLDIQVTADVIARYSKMLKTTTRTM